MENRAAMQPGEGRAVTAISGDRSGMRRVTSAELFAGGKEVIIEHEGEAYRLRCTSKGKLILTK